MAHAQLADASLERRRAWLVGLALLCCYGFFFYRGGNWNVEARNAQIVAIADDHTLAIDPYHHWTGDEAYYRGHYYSDKLIGPSLVAAPIYWLSRRTISLWIDQPRQSLMLALRVANLLTNALPSALIGALLYLFLAELTISPALRVWLALGYGLGTLALPYSTALFGHQLGAVCVAGSFMLLWHQRRQWRLGRGLAAGALVGLGAVSDFTTLLIAAFLAVYALWVATGRPAGEPVRLAVFARRIAPFAALALLPLAGQLAANWAIFGGPFTFPHVHHVQASFQARHTRGMLGVHLPRLYPLYQLTVGPWRGLFYSSPLLLLALPGFFLLGRRWRAETILIAAAWLGVLLMHSGYENWTAGSSFGPRYQIPAIPLLMLPVAVAAKRWAFICKALALISVAFTVAVTAQSPFVDEAIRNPLAVALANFSAGNLLHGNLGLLMGLRGLWSLFPLAVVEAGVLYALAGLSEPDSPAAPTPRRRPRPA